MHKWIFRILFTCALLLAILLGTCFTQERILSPPYHQYKYPATAFVQRSGSSLLLNGKKFRFAGANIYWLGLQESGQGNVYPSSFEVEDALATAQAMGATVIRSHTLGISVGCTLCFEIERGIFNQTALRHMDFAIQAAAARGMKLIIPLVDNWRYYHGGKYIFTNWLGLSDEEMFYSNPQARADFQQYISVLLNHVNTYTGVAYKNDPTILAWEQGNELRAPLDWEQTMADYIKSIDSNHLIASGSYNWGERKSLFAPELAIQSIDIYTSHYYPPSIADLQGQAAMAQDANKVFIAEEYDWNTNNGDSLYNFLSAIEQSNIAGDLYWSLFPHSDTYGYVQQLEHFTLHYPGDTPTIQDRVRMLRAHAYTLSGLPIPTDDRPGTPLITSIWRNKIFWRGAAGAYAYTIERSTISRAGPWTVLCDRCATDNDTPWADITQPSGQLWYRVKASTSSGTYGSYSDIYPIST